MKTALNLSAAVLLLVALAAPASAVTVTDWMLNDCVGCDGAAISLTVDDMGGGIFIVTQGLNLDGYSSNQSEIESISNKSLKGVTNIISFVSPAGSWEFPTIDSKVTGQGCGGSGNDHLCSDELTGGVIFSELDPGWNYWSWTVEAVSVLGDTDQNYGLNWGPSTGRLISATVPEPTGALAFTVGLGIVAGAARRRRS